MCTVVVAALAGRATANRNAPVTSIAAARFISGPPPGRSAGCVRRASIDRGDSPIRSNETAARDVREEMSETEERRLGHPGDPRDGALTLGLAARPPFAADALLRFLGARAVPGLEEVDGRTFRRSLRTRTGRVVVMSLTARASEPVVALGVAVDEPTELASVVQAARRLFDLDADP